MATTAEIDALKPGSPFWQFSLRVYRDQAVQRACLELQDGSGVDVNVLLFMLWLGSNGRQLSGQEVRSVIDAVEPWRGGVVVPLRTARQNLKQTVAAIDAKGAEALRLQVKRMELEAERLQQEALHGMSVSRPLGQPGADVRSACAANLAAYAQALGRVFPAGHVTTMVDAASKPA